MRLLTTLLLAAGALSGQTALLTPCQPNSVNCATTGDQFYWIGDPLDLTEHDGAVTITSHDELMRLLAMRDEEIRKLRRALELVRKLRDMEAELRSLERELFVGEQPR